ncbi:hypothetical protein [Fortiea contorta]|uniref:hypothetical protein n=1 Tax=Fortiea contorta TaxID=1892405 RepID=UPI000375D78D|nr:hypothetical protein [Fortiea contorta]
MNKAVMVIGYGDDLRGDDGIGRQVADAIANWHLLSVKCLAINQLTPELATILASTELVIFVTTCLISESSQVQVQSLLPCFFSFVHARINDPRSLLALTQTIYGHSPTAWLVTIPGVNFAVRENLSAVAKTGIAIALVKIIQILDKNDNLWVDFG